MNKQLLACQAVLVLLTACSADGLAPSGDEDVGQTAQEISLQGNDLWYNWLPDTSHADPSKDERKAEGAAGKPRCPSFNYYVMVGFDQWDSTQTIACRHVSMPAGQPNPWAWGVEVAPVLQSAAEAGAGNTQMYTCPDVSSNGKTSVAIGYDYTLGRPICKELTYTGLPAYSQERHEGLGDANYFVKLSAYQHFGYTHEMHLCKSPWPFTNQGVLLGGFKDFAAGTPGYRYRCGS